MSVMPASLMFSERRWGMPLFSAAMVLCACACAQAATPQEDAFLKVWGAHVRAPNDHKAVIEACQSVMDKSSTLAGLDHGARAGDRLRAERSLVLRAEADDLTAPE